MSSTHSLLFKEVMIDEKLSESRNRPFSDALQCLKKHNPTFFMRSLAFCPYCNKTKKITDDIQLGTIGTLGREGSGEGI